jgi:propionyl-CoA synthetase
VAECAVIGVDDEFKGQIPRGFAVLKAAVSTDPEVLSAELVQLVRDQIGPVAALRRVDVIAALPKTRSGKILRKTMRGIADGRDEAVPSTIEDPAVLDALRPVLTDRDYRSRAGRQQPLPPVQRPCQRGWRPAVKAAWNSA